MSGNSTLSLVDLISEKKKNCIENLALLVLLEISWLSEEFLRNLYKNI